MKFINITTHKFKTNFAQYLRLIENEPDTALMIYKYKKPIGIFAPLTLHNPYTRESLTRILCN